jgi:cytochrome oxidase assembly protein ShyY1
MADESSQSTKKSYTAPKGQPTRARSQVDAKRRAFGPVAQWITLAAVLILAVVILLIITNGGIFTNDPTDVNNLNGGSSAPAALFAA